MDMITLAMAKKYADQQRLGYTEPGMVLSAKNGTETIVINDIPYVKVSDDYIDLSKVDHFYVVDNGVGMELPAEYLNYDSGTVEGITGSYAYMDDNTAEKYAFSFTDEVSPFKKGTWIIDFGELGRFDFIFAETIVQIDKKYIPGAVLPVVELSTAIPADGTETVLTDAESAALTKAANQNMPCLIRCVVSADEVEQKTVTPFTLLEKNELTVFGAYIGLTCVQIIKNGENWIATYVAG